MIKERVRELRCDQRGISAVVIVVSVIAIFGAAILSIDAGNVFQTRRNVIIGTDSAALREAGVLSTTFNPSACSNDWTDIVAKNSQNATPLTCTVTQTSVTTGYVAVDARKQSTARFGGVLGLGNVHPYSFSAAQWGPPTGLLGLRPFAICDQDAHYLEWIAHIALVDAGGAENNPLDPYNQLPLSEPTHHFVGTDGGVVHRVTIDNAATPCGQAPGNWAWLDFNAGSNQTNEIRNWWTFGYPDTANGDSPVVINIHSGPDCTKPDTNDGDGGADGCLPGNTGSAGTSTNTELASLVSSGAIFPLVIFSSLNGQGNGSVFQVVNFIAVKLTGYDNNSSGEHYLDLEFKIHNFQGSCCQIGGPDSGIRVVKLCDVDHDQYRTTAQACA